MSALRARCPDCRTLTAVAIGPDYQCHACGREFAAGLVRVPRAWGAGPPGAVDFDLPWPEAAVVDEPTLDEQIAAQMRTLPGRPLVLGGDGLAHVGAVRELARRQGAIGVLWVAAGAPGAPVPADTLARLEGAVDP